MNDDYYETSDLGLAASLSASGHQLVYVSKGNPKRVVFYFTETPELIQRVERYWSGNLLLSAAVLMEHIKQLKGRIYS